MIPREDLRACREAIRHGSLSFFAASRLFPASVRDPAIALYAFCRMADDNVDLHSAKVDAVLKLRDRLDLVYLGRPMNAAADRAFASIVDSFDLPRQLPDALLEGFAWDAEERRYRTLSDVRAYSARVASSVGAMMTILMGVRRRDAMARACDLGVAMQLTNIARDIGEDARERRLYLPLDWFDEASIDPEEFLHSPRASDAIRAMAKKLVREANRLFIRSESGIASLPRSARPGIFAARFIYAGIGGRIARLKFDSVEKRAHTTTAQKMGWLGQSILRAGATMVMPQSAVIYAKPLPEVEFLVDAAARETPPTRSDTLIAVLAQLEQRRIAEREAAISRA
ncbi:MAG: phytoene/squalene synthase family protein [Aestuariivita sp.]|nr:phytoene/squalene synthase family protein [Aestuariivita sp.]MCY4202977.1 phytoene/squalene synthase family protein [Aestuariivita sp.]